MALIVVEKLIFFEGVMNWSQVQQFMTLQLELWSLYKKYWAKQMSDVLTVFECESAIWMVKLFDGLLHGTSDDKYLSWTCRTDKSHITITAPPKDLLASNVRLLCFGFPVYWKPDFPIESTLFWTLFIALRRKQREIINLFILSKKTWRQCGHVFLHH